MLLHHSRRTGRIAALAVLLLAVLSTLLGQADAAQAAAPAPAATATPQPSPPKPAVQAPVTDQSKAAAARAAASSALRTAIKQDDQTLDCPASLLPDTVYTCAAPDSGSDTFTIPLSRATDFVTFQVVSTGTNMPGLSLTSPDGTDTACTRAVGDGIQCSTGQAGAYTLSVRIPDAGADFSLSYLPLLADTECTPVSSSDLSLGAPTAFTLTQPAGSAGICRTLDAASGDILRMHVTDFQVGFSVLDATGSTVCATDGSTVSDLDCTLTGTAPYRELEYQWFGSADTYTFTAARLNSPTGCPVLQAQAYGTVPDTTSTARCRTLHVSAAGLYEYGPVGGSVNGSLYDSNGASVCTPILLAPCQLAVGDYTWALTGQTASTAYGMWFNATASGSGCTAATDTGFSTGPTTGTLTGAGERLCLTLPTATGNGIYLLQQPTGDQSAVATTVYDAGGVPQCPDTSSVMVCKLTGTAPFHVIVNGPDTGTFGLIMQRTGDGSGCTVWSQSAFGGAWGATVNLTASTNLGCLSIPADQHSTAEMLDYSNLSNSVNANVRLVDAAGNVACQTIGSSTTDCKLTAGQPYTAILQAVNISADTYHLVRRDISSSAACAAPANTKVGGPSTSFTLNSDLDSHCFRITAEAADKFWIGARTDSASSAGAQLQVVDGAGNSLCWQQGVSCRVTGATSYTVIVLASGYAGSTVNTHVDTWLVGTAAGWVPECTANPLSVQGFPVHSGTFTESSTGFCGTVQITPPVSFEVSGTSTATYPATPETSLLSAAHWSSSPEDYYQYQCNGNYGSFDDTCQALSGSDSGQAVLIVSPAGSVSPTDYTFQGICSSSCAVTPAPTLTSITPATGPADSQNQVVLHGTGLTLSIQATLSQNGSQVGSGIQPVSVSADGTSLQASLSTSGLAPGSYDLALAGVGYTVGTPSYGYIPGAYTVTAAKVPAGSRLVPTTPTRFLDTRNGTGVPKGRVGSHGVIKLQVTGVHGIPSTGVTAVVMNVTAVDPSANSFVSAYPDGTTRPDTSNINFQAGQTLPNLVTVPVVNGKVDLYNNAGTVDLLADITGYYTSAAGSAYSPTGPTRLLDTRNGTGARSGTVGAKGTVNLQVAGVKGIPANATAVLLNVTVTNPSSSSYLTVYPHGTPLPGVSNLNYTAHQTVSNLVLVPIIDGMVSFTNHAGTTDVIADVSGYFSD